MALKATIYKAELEVVDMDRNYYATHRLTLACHPSETAERLMIRLLAYGLNAHERLEFGKGISDADEPDLWRKDLTGEIELWIELGHPDERLLVRALGRAPRVIVYTYSPRPELWWEPVRARLERERGLVVVAVDAASVKELAALARATMSLQCSVQDGETWIRDDEGSAVRVGCRALKEPGARR
jgi:uncharacterized protein YaeQ